MSFERARRRRRTLRRGRGGDSIVLGPIRQPWRWLLPALLALVTFVAFLPTLENGFVWDDDVNLLNNPDYRGLGWHQLRWMFTTFLLGHWIPLTWMSFGLDYVLWGMNPLGYHLTSLLLHVANTVVFYMIAVQLLAVTRPAEGDGVAGKLGGVVAALLFAVHPLRVESVAWATERRDVLCGLFYLMAILFYMRAGEAEAGGRAYGRRHYWGSLGLFVLAVLSKSMAVSLPLVLLVLDAYPLRRLGGRPGGWFGPAALRGWLEKAPFALLSLGASVMALVALEQIKGIRPFAMLGWLGRLAISFYSLAFYLWKMLVPLDLSPLYELPNRIEPSSWPYVGAGVLVGAVTAGTVALRRRWPALLAVWVSYVVILLPVLGIVQNGPQIAADRYTYLAGLGWALLAGAGLGAWGAAEGRRLVQRQRAMVLAGAAVVIAVALGTLTWGQAQVWHDPRSLWTHALSTDPSAVAHYNLGVFIARQGELAEAVRHYREAVALKPDYADARINLGDALSQQGDLVEATEHYRRAVALRPGHAGAHYNLGTALAEQGDLAEATGHLRLAVALNPGYGEAHNHLGIALALQGQLDEAIQHYQAALKINPSNAVAHNNLGLALARLGQRKDAIEHFRRALSIRADFRQAQDNLDRLLAGNGSTP